MRKYERQIGCYLDPESYKALTQYAQLEQTSVSHATRKAVLRHLQAAGLLPVPTGNTTREPIAAES